MARRRSSNYIYGGEVFLQQKSRINPHEWRGREDLNWYLLRIIRKDVDYFRVWGNLKGKSLSLVIEETEDILEQDVRDRVGCEKDDLISEPNGRVYYWSVVNYRRLGHQTAGRGHGANQVIFRGNTFCARDRGRYYLGNQG